MLKNILYILTSNGKKLLGYMIIDMTKLKASVTLPDCCITLNCEEDMFLIFHFSISNTSLINLSFQPIYFYIQLIVNIFSSFIYNIFIAKHKKTN
jgi:hypothetical protein